MEEQRQLIINLFDELIDLRAEHVKKQESFELYNTKWLESCTKANKLKGELEQAKAQCEYYYPPMSQFKDEAAAIHRRIWDITIRYDEAKATLKLLKQ